MERRISRIALILLFAFGCAEGVVPGATPPVTPPPVDAGITLLPPSMPPPMSETDAGMEEPLPPKDSGMDDEVGYDGGSGGSGGDAGTDPDPGFDAGPPPAAGPCSPAMMAGSTASGTTDGAPNVVSPSCVGSNGSERAFLYNPPSSGMYRIHTTGSVVDTVLAVFAGATCTGAELGCNDDAGGGLRSSEVTLMLAAGQPVSVVVDTYGTSGGGDFMLAIEPASAGGGGETSCTDGIDNDGDGQTDCADSECRTMAACTVENCTDGIDNDGDGQIDCADSQCASAAACAAPDCSSSPEGANLASLVGMEVATGTTEGLAHDFTFASPCANSAPDKVFRWTAPSTGPFTIDTCGSGFDTMLWVASTCDATMPLVCNDDGPTGFCAQSLRSSLVLNATAGTQYLIGVAGYLSNSGHFVLNIRSGM